MVERAGTGLIYQSDGSLAGWTGTGWASQVKPRYVNFGPLGRVFYDPPLSLSSLGAREPYLLAEDGIFTLLFDSGNGVNPCRQWFARSTDRGLTWGDPFPASEGLSKVGGGNWGATATGAIEKRGGTYYRERVTATDSYAADTPYPGLPAGTYKWDTWKADSISGPWTGIRDQDIGLSSEYATQPGSVAFDASSGYFYSPCSTFDPIPKMRLVRSATREGNLANAGIMCDEPTGSLPKLPGGRFPENGRLFYSDTLQRWVCIVNCMNAGTITHTDANGSGYSSSASDWSSSAWEITQAVGSIDGTRAVGVQAPVAIPEGLVLQTDGFVPVTFDADPTHADPNWHGGRHIRGAVLEPSLLALSCSGAGSFTERRVDRTFTAASSASVQWQWKVFAANGSGCILRCYLGPYEIRLDRSAGTLSIRKAGTSLASVSCTATFDNPLRSKVTFASGIISASIEGISCSYTDSGHPGSVATLGLSGQGADCEVRRLSVRTSDSLTIQGLQPGEVVTIRSYGGFAAGQASADSTGVATYTQSFWPLGIAEIRGSDFSPTGGLWGGDSIRLPSNPARNPHRRKM